MPWKLFIYDTGDEDNKDQAEGRYSDEDMIIPLPAGEKDELTDGLTRLIKQGWTFDRVLVQTHGTPGSVIFGETYLGWPYFSSTLPTIKIEKLFPYYTKIYFDGCNVGADDEGTEFVTQVGYGLLKKAGGEVLAWTSAGYAMWGWVPFIGNRTIHYTGSVKRAYFGKGGKLINPDD